MKKGIIFGAVGLAIGATAAAAVWAYKKYLVPMLEAMEAEEDCYDYGPSFTEEQTANKKESKPNGDEDSSPTTDEDGGV